MPSVDDSVLPDPQSEPASQALSNGHVGARAGREMNGHYSNGLPRPPRSRSIARGSLVDREPEDEQQSNGGRTTNRKAYEDLPPRRVAPTPLEYTPAHVMAQQSYTIARMGVLSEISEINDFIFLSGVQPLRLDRLRAKKISLIVNATMDEPNVYLQGVDTLKVRVQDSPSALLSVYFDQVADRIKKERDADGKVLVHCVAGISRSTSLILAYMIKHERTTLRDAFMRVKSRRTIVRPNPGFWRQLIDFEARVRGRASVKFVLSKWGDYVPDVYTDQISHSTSAATRLSSTIDSLGRSLSSASNGYTNGFSSNYTNGNCNSSSSSYNKSNTNTNPSLYTSRYSTGILSNSTYSRLYRDSNNSYLPSKDTYSKPSSTSSSTSYRYPHRSLTLPVSPFYTLNSSSSVSSAPSTPVSPSRSSYRSIYASSSRGNSLSPAKASPSSLIAPLSTMFYSDLLYKT